MIQPVSSLLITRCRGAGRGPFRGGQQGSQPRCAVDHAVHRRRTTEASQGDRRQWLLGGTGDGARFTPSSVRKAFAVLSPYVRRSHVRTPGERAVSPAMGGGT